MKKPAETPSVTTKQYNLQLQKLDTDELVKGDILVIQAENGRALEFLVVATAEEAFPNEKLNHDFHIIVKCIKGPDPYLKEVGFITSRNISINGDTLLTKFIKTPIQPLRIVVTRSEGNDREHNYADEETGEMPPIELSKKNTDFDPSFADATVNLRGNVAEVMKNPA